jgi:type I restriction enzyme S subunit
MDGDFHMGKWAGGEAYLNQRVVRFRPRNSVPQYYLFLALRNPIQQFGSTIVGTTVAHLSDRDLRTIHLLVPTKEILIRLQDTFDPIFDLEIKLRLKNRILRRTRDLLLPKLIAGDVDVTQVNIDPEIKEKSLT